MEGDLLILIPGKVILFSEDVPKVSNAEEASLECLDNTNRHSCGAWRQQQFEEVTNATVVYSHSLLVDLLHCSSLC
jgi:hypothetical protein